MQEEWAVVIVNGQPQGESEPRDMVGIAEVSVVDPQAHVTICEDDAEANRIAKAVCEQLGLPMYDGADAFVREGDASRYVDVDADGEDPYSNLRNIAPICIRAVWPDQPPA